MEEKIRIENVTKKFGSYAALDGISLSFEKGKIHGMIGRNGSGKTVLFKCICGFLRVDDGAVFVDGKQIGKEIEAPESIGAIIETPGFLPGYSARQNLQFLAGIRRKIGKKEIDAAIRKVGLDPEAKKHVGKYSLGMRQRLGIAQAIMEEPSLLILDEIGRGTSTFDGLSIAWAVVEYIANTKLLGAKTLFATHYHELTELEGTLDGVNNYCIAVKENGDDIVFLRKIIKGGADKSYGIQVAKLAGVPDTVIERAKELVADLSDADISLKARDIAQYSKKQEKLVDSYKKVDDLEVKQMSLFDTVNNDDIIEDIKALDISNMTPIDALNTLYKLQGRVKNRW